MIHSVLDGHRVLVCRPEPSASELCSVLESVGAKAYAFPCIEIASLELNAQDRSLIFELDQFEKVVVVSQHAARIIAEHIDEIWPQLPTNQLWIGIGRKTSEILDSSGFTVLNPQQDLDSEALLELKELASVKDSKILIARGRGGRSKLEQGLRDRGANIKTIELYERLRTEYTAAEVHQALVEFEPTSIIALSSETLENFHQLASGIEHSMSDTLLVVPSGRVAKLAASLGYSNVRISTELKPIDLIKALKRQD